MTRRVDMGDSPPSSGAPARPSQGAVVGGCGTRGWRHLRLGASGRMMRQLAPPTTLLPFKELRIMRAPCTFRTLLSASFVSVVRSMLRGAVGKRIHGLPTAGLIPLVGGECSTTTNDCASDPSRAAADWSGHSGYVRAGVAAPHQWAYYWWWMAPSRAPRPGLVESPRVQEARTRVTLSCYGLSGAKPVTRHGRAAMSRRADEARPFPRYIGVLEGARTGCRRWVKFRRCARQLLGGVVRRTGGPPAS